MKTTKEIYCKDRAEVISEYNNIPYEKAYKIAEAEFEKSHRTSVAKPPVDEQLFEDLLMEQQEQM